MPVTHRKLDDPIQIRTGIFDRVMNAVNQKYPIENTKYRLGVTNLRWDKPKEYGWDDRKKAILSGDSLNWKLKGNWTLYDRSSGKTVDKLDRVIAHVPYMTNSGTFVYNGNEYTIAHQMRLRPGVYARLKDNGEVESHFNILPGSGSSFRVWLDPKSGVLRMRVGQANIPLYTVLKTLGVSDKEMGKYWGNELLNNNVKRHNASALKAAYNHLVPSYIRSKDGDQAKELKTAFSMMNLDPDVTEATLGTRYNKVTSEALLRASQKVVGVHKGTEDVDDRDSLAYQTFHGPEDFFSERILRDASGLGRQLLFKATLKGGVQHIPSGALSQQMRSVLLNSGLAQALEEVNPMDIKDQLVRVSRLGMGGIPSVDAVPDEARNVQPSYFGFIDAVRGPESQKIGVDLRVAYGALKGSDGRLYAKFLNPKTGKPQLLASDKATKMTISFPGEMASKKSKVRAMVGGRLRYVDRGKVDFEVMSPAAMFSIGSNLVPMINNIKAGRLLMGGKMTNQALPLRNGEAPHVQSLVPGTTDTSFQELIGESMGAVKSKTAGNVTRVDKDAITIRGVDGKSRRIELAHNFPYNRKTFLHQTPLVKAGDRIKPGQLIARSNYTTPEGTTNMGLNVRVAYLPFSRAGGVNYEDAVIVSESLAKRFTSEHMYTREVESDTDKQIDHRAFVSLFPAKYTKTQLERIDNNGLVKPGTVVERDDPLILSVSERSRVAGKIHRARSAYSDKSVTWDHDQPGLVTDVYKTKRGWQVAVKSYSPAQQGDKLTGRHGNKATIASVVPDEQMPTNAEGLPIELMLGPEGVVTRGNPAQMVETSLGKISAKTGKPYKLPGFYPGNRVQFALDELARHNMKAREDLTDPVTKRKLKDIFTGNIYFMKLHHMAEAKAGGRGEAGAFTSEEAPARGGPTGSKRIGMLAMTSLMSHGATDVLRDAKLVRGQRNDDYWKAFRMGYPPPSPKAPFVYDKFLAMMNAAGINTKKSGDFLHVLAMTDSDVKKLSHGEIKSGDTVDFTKGMKPIPGGLFDEGVTGGPDGKRWGHISLNSVMPNPVMEEPIRRILGVTKQGFEDILRGQHQLPGGTTGPSGMYAALDRIKLDQAIAVEREVIKSGAKSKRDGAVKRLGYFMMCKKYGMHPRDFMISKMPVLPPAFRPISMLKGPNIPIVADANLLYKELININNNYAKLKKSLGEDGVGDERLSTYKALKAVSGLGDPISVQSQEKGVRGLLAYVFGKGSPKYGMFQRRVIGMSVDVVGRGVITPNPNLDMDHVGLPEKQAWTIYRPILMRQLVRKGMSPARAAAEISNKSKVARSSLEDAIKEYPVVINRAPSLHRYSLMAAWPVLVKGNTLQISPLVTPGFNADFDGDTMQYHVPIDPKARHEAIKKLLPSKNLLSTSEFDVHYVPRHGYLAGLWAATSKKKKGAARSFRSQKDVVNAWRRGEINVDDPVEILT